VVTLWYFGIIPGLWKRRRDVSIRKSWYKKIVFAQRRGGEMIEENRIGKEVIAAAIIVHRGLGPGLLESVYKTISCP
jgi:hypothetical protein